MRPTFDKSLTPSSTATAAPGRRAAGNDIATSVDPNDIARQHLQLGQPDLFRAIVGTDEVTELVIATEAEARCLAQAVIGCQPLRKIAFTLNLSKLGHDGMDAVAAAMGNNATFEAIALRRDTAADRTLLSPGLFKALAGTQGLRLSIAARCCN